MIAALYAIGRWLRSHPWIAVALVVMAVLGSERARRALVERRLAREIRQRVEAEDTAAATTEALERRDAGAHTQREVIDAAREEANAHPDDPEAPARAAREYARERYRELREADPDRDPADPVHRDAAAGAAARGRGR